MTGRPNLEEIDFRDLPHHLVLEMHRFGVAMIGIDRAPQEAKHQGSGTLVQFDGNHYILTAGHCAESIQKYKELGLTIGARETAAPELPPHPFPPVSTREDFDSSTLPVDFQWLRSPWPDELFSLTARRGYLRLFGRETTGSMFRQALVARRQQAHCYSASTVIEFEPQHYQQQAGLISYYNGFKFHYLYVLTDDVVGKHIRVMTCHPELPDTFTPPISIAAGMPVQLRVDVDYERLRFAFRAGGDWQWLPEVFDASTLSDEAGPPGLPDFTGAFVGMCCQDCGGTGHPADFDYFEYHEREFSAVPSLSA